MFGNTISWIIINLAKDNAVQVKNKPREVILMQISETASLTNYLLPVYQRKVNHPAIIILPGGSYTFISQRESYPVAVAFNAIGMQSFVLDYTTWEKNHQFTFQMLVNEVKKTIDYIVDNAEVLRVDPEQIYIIGFSAGAHLAAISGSLFYRYIKRVILAYPALTSKYLPEDKNVFYSKLSIEDKTSIFNILSVDASDYISKNTPPTFIWSTYEDQIVDVQGILDYIRRLNHTKIACEFHLFEKGQHGLSLANESTAMGKDDIDDHVAKWFFLLKEWLKN